MYLIGKKYSQDEIDKANELAYQSELLVANELGKYKGYQDLMYTKASELFMPITQSTGLKMKQQTDDQVIQDIQNDPNLSNEDKLRLISGMNKIKLEKHTPQDEAKITPAEQRKKEVTEAFRLQNDSIFGLVPIEGIDGEYMFGILNVLSALGMASSNREVLLDHHRIRFNLEAGKIEIATNLSSIDPAQFDYMYSKDLLLLLTQNTTDGTITARKNYLDIIDKCMGELLGVHKFRAREENYGDFLERVKGNKKFEKWISVKYSIPLRVLPLRAQTSGTTRYTDTSVYKSPGLEENEENEEGSGFIEPSSQASHAQNARYCILSPHTNDRIKRAFVLLGHKKSSKENNPDTLAEFTSILDSLLSEGSLSVDKYKLLLKKFNV